MKKIVFFDVDGTLLTPQREVPKSVKSSIQALQEQGIICAIATGRPPFGIFPYLESLNMDTFVSLNGQYVISKGEVVYANQVNHHSLKQLVEVAEQHKHRISFVTPDEMIGNAPNWYGLMQSKNFLIKLGSLIVPERIQKKVAEFVTRHHKYQKIVPSDYEGKEIYQVILHAPEIFDSYYQEKFPDYRFTRWGSGSMDVCPDNGSKAVGIEALLDYLEIDLAHSYAFGDGLNDIEMLQYVGTGVAMGNGRVELKEVADVITADAKDDGILKGLQKVGLLKK
ncbi:Cof-type HAD-IIB family hydrolase [Isobaculum melis]|uniref:Cof subfamily of IIB subfamily of haloacid dehalogenase superfamily/HAD-superfamily hydrolase, subfamily IIB n=1 Tax=Isobaculum melis TaxID=142588 RepID=A0A1H9SP55_9LACT|nr:Cof-type HAD-IIB family hydrolase [Isobaculum melis]SER86746.1 hypothetical protein SAMN04488559_10869 [Isobaculum melis]